LSDRDRTAGKVVELRKGNTSEPVPARPARFDVSDEEWALTWLKVLAFALGVTRSEADARDLRQESYVRLFTSRPWKKDVTFLKHMLNVAKSIRGNAIKAARSRAVCEAKGGEEYKRQRVEETASPEDRMLAHGRQLRSHDFAARVLAELRRRLAGFPLEMAILDYGQAAQEREENEGEDVDEDDEGNATRRREPGRETPAELAAELGGVSAEEVTRARARIRRYRESVVAAVRRELAGQKQETDEGDP
jgi:hypothetical protein